MRNLCEASNTFSSSLYYMFKNKDSIVLSATEYGLNIVINSLFEYAFTHINDTEDFLEYFPNKVQEFKNELRFIYQVLASPQYGESMRLLTKKLSDRYDEYTDILAQYLGCSKMKLRPYVSLAIAAVLDYIIWNDAGNMQREMSCIYDSVQKCIIE